LAIVFMPTLACDCACDYCFDADGAASLRRPDWSRRFAEIRALAEGFGAEDLLLHWRGGEVMLLGIDAVREGLGVAKRVFEGSPFRVEHRLQTNLLSYDGEWATTIREHFGGRLGSSFDWPNRHRSRRGGTFGDFQRRWKGRFDAARADGLDVGVIALPNEASLEVGAEAFYNWYKDAGVLRLQVNLPFPGRRGASAFPAKVDFEAYADFMEGLFDVWLSDGRALELSPFGQLLDRVSGRPASLPCLWSEDCTELLLAVGPEGEAAQCDCWLAGMALPHFGKLAERGAQGILESGPRRELAGRPARLLASSRCGLCRHWGFCHGGCPVRALTFEGNSDLPDPWCPVYLRVFDRALACARSGTYQLLLQ
jgi:radical SAM protein with 4Fe4S-binding SPASM domain